jgi:hypothetical protein
MLMTMKTRIEAMRALAYTAAAALDRANREPDTAARIEAARDERIVQGAHRQQALAEQRPGQAQRRQHQEQVVLGDPQLDMLAGTALRPELRRGHPLRLEHVGVLGAVEHAAPADPGAEAGRDGDIG